MHIRPATSADIHAIAEIGTRAFADDPMYAHFFPWRFQYPDDFYRFFVEDTREALASTGQLIMVTVTDDADQRNKNEEDPPSGTIVAYAIVIRSGGPADCDLWNADSLLKKLWRLSNSLRSYWNFIFSPNRALYLPVMQESTRRIAAVYAQNTKMKTGRIEFDTLAVDPTYQRRGYGDKLVEWVGMRVWEEDTIGLGISSTANLPMYLRYGCEEVGRIVMPQRIVNIEGKPGTVTKLDSLEIVVLKWKV